jgi:hypothetical protein
MHMQPNSKRSKNCKIQKVIKKFVSFFYFGFAPKCISEMSPANPSRQGCQMVYFQTKNSYLGKFWRFLQWKMLVYFIYIWSILRQFDIFYGQLVYFVVIWYLFPRFGIVYQEESGNPASQGVIFVSRHFLRLQNCACRFGTLKVAGLSPDVGSICWQHVELNANNVLNAITHIQGLRFQAHMCNSNCEADVFRRTHTWPELSFLKLLRDI